MARDPRTGAPAHYAAEKLPTMRARWTSAAGEWARRFAGWWPGVPPTAILALSSNSTGASEAYQDPGQRDFWALGLYQTPAGPDTGPHPNPDPNAPHNAWTRLGRDPRFRAAFGREGTTGADWASAIADQTLIGILDYRDGGSAVARALPETLRPSIAGGQWEWTLAVMGYVVGAGGAAAILRRYARALERVPEQERLGALARAMATEGAPRGDVYPVIRTLQRFAVGEALARAEGLPTGWYELHLPRTQRTEIENHLAAIYYGQAQGGIALSPAGTMAPVLAGIGLGLAVSAAAAAWYFRRRP